MLLLILPIFGEVLRVIQKWKNDKESIIWYSYKNNGSQQGATTRYSMHFRVPIRYSQTYNLRPYHANAK